MVGRITGGVIAALVFAGSLTVISSGAAAQSGVATVTADFDSLKVINEPGHARRHTALRSVKSLPPDGRTVVVDCAINRRSGWPVCRAPGSNYPIDCDANPPGSCTIYPDPVRDPILLAAAEIAGGYRFDPASVPGPAEKSPRTRITVRLSPADLATFSPPPDVTPLPMDAVTWKDRSMEYPDLDRLLEAEGQASVTCQIQSDGALLCGDVTSSPRKSVFIAISDELEVLWHAAPMLQDGTPSAGRWVQIVITFKLDPLPKG
jgi:hypothetical protein